MNCPVCDAPAPLAQLQEANWLAPAVLAHIARQNPGWQRAQGACPACVQHALLHTLHAHGIAAAHAGIQANWPLDAEAAFGVLPTPLRMRADPHLSARGVTLAMVDADFYPHPDLIQPLNRIRAWVDAASDPVRDISFASQDVPRWPGWDAAAGSQWHGTMTSVCAAGNGWLSHGLYRGIASDADVVLLRVRDDHGRITNNSISRALNWLRDNAARLGIRVVNLSLGGDATARGELGNTVNHAVAELAARDVLVVAAAGNDGGRLLLPPASSPHALTVGGIDDHGTLTDPAASKLWHSNFGRGSDGGFKPEVVAPSLWVVAPVLPGSSVAREAAQLFASRHLSAQAHVLDPNDAAFPRGARESGIVRGQAIVTNPLADVEARIRTLKLVTPHYQHVDGTSFAAPIVASIAACVWQAHPALSAAQVRARIIAAAVPVAGAGRDRQGAGVVDAGRATA